MNTIALSLVERLETAVRMEGKGEFEQALECYRSVVTHDPNALEALSLLGKLEYRLGDHESAVLHLQRASRLAPMRADIHLGLGQALHESGKKRQAAKSYLRAVDVDVSFAPAYVGLGRIFAENRQWDKAERAFQLALEIGSADPDVHYQLGKVHFVNGEAQHSFEALEKAQRLGGEYADFNWLCAELCIQMGLYEKAKDYAEADLEERGENSAAWTTYALVLIHLEALSEAMRACQMALQFDARNSQALAQLGSIHFLRNDYKGARRSFDVALKMNDSNQAALIGLAQIEEQKANYDTALRYLRRIGAPKTFALKTALLCSRVAAARGQYTEAIKLLEYRLTHGLDNRRGRADCHEELAKLHYGHDQFIPAFKHFQFTNDLSKELYPDGVELFSPHEIKKFFSRPVRELPQASLQTAKPVFVVGAVGVVREIIGEIFLQDPCMIRSSGKISLEDIAQRLPHELASPDSFPQVLAQIRSAELYKLSQDYLQLNNFQNELGSIFLDFDPHNVEFLGLAKMLFPNLTVVRIKHDWRHLLLDQYCRRRSKRDAHIPYGFRGIKNYLASQQAWLDHWSTICEVSIVEIDLCTLVEHSNEVLERIFSPLEFQQEPFQKTASDLEKQQELAYRCKAKINKLGRFLQSIDALMPNFD